MQIITRNGSFDSMHRVMNEKMKCFNIHGHTYLYELSFSFSEEKSIGYAIDFKEIKRVAAQWIDDVLDHGAILNPHDLSLVSIAEELSSKYWIMSLNGSNEYCNPTVENIVREMFFAMEVLFQNYESLKIESIKLYETPNCHTTLKSTDIVGHLQVQRMNWRSKNHQSVLNYAKEKGVLEYDDRNN